MTNETKSARAYTVRCVECGQRVRKNQATCPRCGDGDIALVRMSFISRRATRRAMDRKAVA